MDSIPQTKIPQKRKSSLGESAGQIGSRLNYWYARLMVRSITSDRLAVYRKLSALLRNRFSLMDALDRLHQIASKDGKNPDDTMAIAIHEWVKSIQNGESFSVALRGWAPPTELLMLSVGDIANLELALDNTVNVVEGMNKMKGPVVNAIAYPSTLICMVLFLIYGVGRWMVPPMVDAVPGMVWTGLAKSLVDLSYFVADYTILFFAALPVLFLIVLFSFPRWRGRSRTMVENVPPWSIYRIFIGVGWLLSLAALVKAGTPVSKAMRSLRADASPYLLYRIDRTLIYINNGDNLGDALYRTGLKFPDEEIVGDLRIYAELDNFQDALESLAQDWLNNSIRDIEQKAAILNGVAILLIAAVVAWVVMGTFAMQEQMVSGMGVA